MESESASAFQRNPSLRRPTVMSTAIEPTLNRDPNSVSWERAYISEKIQESSEEGINPHEDEREETYDDQDVSV
jgi:hypothetical protein